MSTDMPVLVIGGGGHAKVVVDTLLENSTKILGIVDPLQPMGSAFSHIPWIANEDELSNYDPTEIELINAVGSIKETTRRFEIFKKFKTLGFNFRSIRHPSSVVSKIDISSGEGLQVMAGAVINVSASLGDNVLINTRAVVEHDTTIGSNTHVASGAVICGGCLVGENVHVGAGSTVNQSLTIGSGSVIASGSVIIDNVQPFSLVAGVPAKVKRLFRHE